MIINLKFKNINKSVSGKIPKVLISVNGEQWYQGEVSEVVCLDRPIKHGPFDLRIRLTNKQETDTVLVNGKITNDMNFELDDICIDGLYLHHLKWQSQYVCDNGQKINGCLFFGPSGVWHLSAYTPILRWMLETNHTINNNDPTWEEDYSYYRKACQILNKL